MQKPSAVMTFTETDEGLRVETKYLLADGVSEAADDNSVAHSAAHFCVTSIARHVTCNPDSAEISQVTYATRLS